MVSDNDVNYSDDYFNNGYPLNDRVSSVYNGSDRIVWLFQHAYLGGESRQIDPHASKTTGLTTEQVRTFGEIAWLVIGTPRGSSDPSRRAAGGEVTSEYRPETRVRSRLCQRSARWSWFVEDVMRLARAGLFAILAVVVLGVSGCAVGAGNDEQREPVEPPISLLPGVDSKKLELPLDRYRADAEEYLAIPRARRIVFKLCMQRFGFVLPNAPSIPNLLSLRERRYGVTDAVAAAQWGYHPPEMLADSRQEAEQLPPEADAVAVGQMKSYRGRTVPDGGCAGEADRALNESAPSVPNPHQGEDLSTAAYRLTEQDSRVRAVFKAWSLCMKRFGYDYQSPWDANDDPRFKTERPTDRRRDPNGEGRRRLQETSRPDSDLGVGRHRLSRDCDPPASPPTRGGPQVSRRGVCKRAPNPRATRGVRERRYHILMQPERNGVRRSSSLNVDRDYRAGLSDFRLCL